MTDNFEKKVAVDGPVVNAGELGSSTFSPGQALPAGPLGLGQRWTVARKREVVLRLLRDEPVQLLSRQLGVEIGKPARRPVIPPSGMPDSRWGFRKAVRSLTQCGEPMRFAMAAPIDLRNDFDQRLTAAPREEARDGDLRAVVCWVGEATMVAAGRMRRGSAYVVCRSFATGCCASTPADRTSLVDGKHRPRSSKLNADHRRRTGGGC